MREDLDFLYQKAMRSKSIRFMTEVESYFWRIEDWKRYHEIHNRILNLLDLDNQLWGNKFSFLMGDSQMGENWYRNRK